MVLAFHLIVFRVNRVWKGLISEEIETAAPGVLQPGNELLVRARTVPPDPEYFPIRGSTQLQHGLGRKPKAKQPAS
jgi:hypothetical protein